MHQQTYTDYLMDAQIFRRKIERDIRSAQDALQVWNLSHRAVQDRITVLTTIQGTRPRDDRALLIEQLTDELRFADDQRLQQTLHTHYANQQQLQTDIAERTRTYHQELARTTRRQIAQSIYAAATPGTHAFQVIFPDQSRDRCMVQTLSDLYFFIEHKESTPASYKATLTKHPDGAAVTRLPLDRSTIYVHAAGEETCDDWWHHSEASFSETGSSDSHSENESSSMS